MTNERGLKTYRKLVYFYENKIKVHFKDLDDIFYNGVIIDLSEKKLTMVLRERVRGTIPILLEFVNPETIQEFKEEGKWNAKSAMKISQKTK